MEEQDDYAISTVKEMTDFFETRVEDLEPRESKKNLLKLQKKNYRETTKKGKKMTLAQVLWSLVNNHL